ncbi:MAG: (2Fe-2S) ferredoxin domain-containing protein [Candidatus Sericytochromatia bacterium]|nr:(2Fe-2S) ferredoxin domain-containing protein [Candidatus Sericytochromatia bacterium]
MPKPRHHLLVCTNERPADHPKGSCAPRGSEKLLAALKREVVRRGLQQEVFVTKSGCLKSCPYGPVVTCWPEGHFLSGCGEAEAPALLDAILEGNLAEERFVPEDEIGRY